jgi:hypothetical protein
MLCMAAGPSTTDRCAYGVIAGLDKLCARRVPKESATGSRSVDDRPHPRGRGLLALTFGSLLSSQGAGAHRYWASRPVSGQLAKRYSAGFAVSNPEVWPHHPHITLGRGIRGVGGMGARPVRRSTGVRGVEHGRRTVAVESNPLVAALPDRGPVPSSALAHGDDRARRQAGGGARTRTKEPRRPPSARVVIKPGRPAPTLRSSRPSTRTGAPPAARTPAGCPEV